jgi:hypothetical protein
LHCAVVKQKEIQMKNSILKAITTDIHFWVPAAVLIIGFVLLFILK